MDIGGFRRALLGWYERQKRDLPWRQTRDPYRIWVSEIMLQQTRVAAVIPYYARFLERFPTVEALAAAPEPELLGAWAGLGYYSRARNLQKAARQVVEAGGFPETYEGIRALAGIGDYTAAAVGSIAFGLPVAVLDGNVMRVLTRLDNDASDIQVQRTRVRLRERARELLDAKKAAAFNQAMMELGATVCLPKKPQCLLCPVERYCEGRRAGVEGSLPVKGRKAVIERVTRILVWVEGERGVLARLKKGFWELPEESEVLEAEWGERVGKFSHAIMSTVYRFELVRGTVRAVPPGFEYVPLAGGSAHPVSTVTRKAAALISRG
jgi:A/G-specific adenine glycosylase